LILLARKEYSECIEVTSSLLALQEDDAKILQVLGEAFLGGRSAADAAERFRELVRRRPNDALAHDLLGRALLAQLDAVKAGEWFSRATQLAPDNATFWLHLGVARSNAEDSVAALEALDQAIRVDGEYADAHFARAVCLAGDGDLDQARVSLQAALVLDPPLLQKARQAEVLRGILATNDDRSAPGS
jgi:tetratricopeptide (TPR) repeat protein